MNLRQYLYVSTLARELHFSRAAEELGIAQPSLSQFIKKIETELGAELFSRNGADVKLTDAGRIYLDYGQKIINLQHGMEDALTEIAEYRTGKLRIALSPCRCDTIMPGIVSQFIRKYPGIEVCIQEMLAGGLLRGIENDDFDLGVTAMPQDTSGFVVDPVLQEEILLAVPESSALHEQLLPHAEHDAQHLYPEVDFSLMDGKPFIVMQEWQVMQKQLAALCEQCKIHIRPVVECTNNRTMIMMVQNGIGCALLPDSIAQNQEHSPSGHLTLYSIKQHVPCRKTVTIYRKGKNLSEPAKYMLELLKNIKSE